MNRCQLEVSQHAACRGGTFSTLWKHIHTELIRLSRSRATKMSRLLFSYLNWLDACEVGTYDPPRASFNLNKHQSETVAKALE